MHVYDDETPPPPDDNAYGGGNVRTLARPTHDPAAEQALLATILDNPETLPDLADTLNPDDFYDTRHETIWTALLHILHTDGILPDPVTLAAHLQTTGELPQVAPLLPDLATNARNPLNLPTYARIIRDHADRRRALAEARQLVQKLETTTHDDYGTLADALYQHGETIAHHAAGSTATTSGHTNLDWLLTGQMPVVDPPAWIRRADGHATFYAGRVNGVFGDPEAAKSWLAMIGAVEALTAGQRTAYIDVDHNGPQIITERLILLGARPEDLANPDRFQLHEPDDGPALMTTIDQLAAWTPAYVVLDSIGEMMPMLGIKSVDNDELSTALRTTATRLAKTGACVVTVDHLPKNTEARTSGFAIGGTAKKRAIDGAYLHAEAQREPAPGHIGKIALRIEKDRPGRLREHATGKYLGTFTIDSTTPGITTISIGYDGPPKDNAGNFRYTIVMERVSRYLEDRSAPPSQSTIVEDVKGNAKQIRAALETLCDEGFVSATKATSGRGGGYVYHSIAHYRRDDDDQPE